MLPNLLNWLISPHWQISFQIFHDTLRDALMEQEGISRDAASEIVKEAFEKYLMSALIGNRLKGNRFIASSIKNFAIQIPGLVQVYHRTRSIIPMFRNDMSLQRFLKSSSPYHKDFMPVYKTVTNPPRN
jgi:hypothetical protein